MLETRYYVICLCFKGNDYFLIWCTGPDGEPDKLLSLAGEHRFVVARSKFEIGLIADELGLPLEAEEPGQYDIDDLFNELNVLLPDQPLNVARCKLMLDCWNMFEDMAKTLSVRLLDVEEGSGDLLSEIYSKLFYGNNLPSMTPDEERFEPEFSPHEIAAMRAYFSILWAEIYALNNSLWH